MKRRERSARAVEAARGVCLRFGLARREDIDIEIVAAALEAFTRYGALTTGEGRLLSDGTSSIIRVAASLFGTAKARFVVAHELGHHLLHAGTDHFSMCTGEISAGGSRFRVEAEASDFAGEQLVPTAMAEARCAGDAMTLEEVLALASDFGVSFTVAALRAIDMARAPCAFVESRGGRIKRACGTEAFDARIVRGRALDPRTGPSQGELPRGARVVPGEAWGAAHAEVIEASLPIPGTDAALTWLHAMA